MLSAGQIDAGFAALAGFTAGAIAVRSLSPADLGVYALLFLAFGVCSQVPAQLVFSPAEVLIAHRPLQERFGSLRWSVKHGAGISAGAALVVAAGALPFASVVDLGSLLPLVLTAVTFSMVSPMQDHVRRVLHAAERSERAALVSVVNVVATVGGALALHQLGDLWVPFGSMSIGNAVSAGFGMWGVASRPRVDGPRFGDLIQIGRWLLVVGIANAGGKYVAATVVGWIVGPAAIGFIEAARLVARPSEVFAFGLLAAVGPRTMVAAAAGDRPAILGLRKVYSLVVVAATVAYAAVVALPTGWALPKEAFPNAFAVPGLLLAILGAQLLADLLGPLQGQLMGERKEAKMARIEIVGQIGRLVSSLSAWWIGPFAIPLGNGIAHGLKLVGYTRTVEPRPLKDPTVGL
jgi:O-antigen/teichoic acid export membrane protein